jgi:hypothetical protein
MAENQTPAQGFADVFLNKLKEQSFVIMLMLGVIYYQHRLMEERVSFWQTQYEEKEADIKQLVTEERKTLLERIEYLQTQRDKYVEDAITELKK